MIQDARETPHENAAVAARHARVRAARQSVRMLALLIIAIGAVSFIAPMAGLPKLAQPLSGFAPMHALTSLVWVGAGAALWAFTTRRYALQIVSAASALIVGLVPLVLDGHWAQATGLSISVVGSALPLIAAFGLLVAAFKLRQDLIQLTFGIAGFVLIALAMTVIGGRIIGAFGPVEVRAIVGASPQGLLSALVMGAAFLILIWAEGFPAVEAPRWIATAVGVASLVTITLIWRALDQRETLELETQTLLAAQEERRIIYREIAATASSFRRAAEWAESGVADDQERRDLAALVRDVPGLAATVRLTRERGATIVVPPASDVAPVTDIWRKGTDGTAASDTLWYAALDPQGVRFAIISPVCHKDICDGAIAGVIDARALFARILADARRDFLFVVVQNDNVIGTDSLKLPTSPWHKDVNLQLGHAHWALVAIPTAETLDRFRTTLPAAVLFMGLIVSALLCVSLRLAQTAWGAARSSERARLAAALERSTDGIWEWDLVTGYAERGATLWRHLGYDPSEIEPVPASWTSRIHPEDLEEVERALDRHIEGKTPNFNAEYRVQAKNGKWHTIVDRGRVVDTLPSGGASRLLGITADVTESRRIDAAVQELETLAAMGRVAARVAHEINNPLAGIQYSFLLVKDAIPPDHPHFSYVGAIEREIKRIATVTRQLYETYRPEQEISASASLATVIGDAVAFMQQVNRAAQVSIVTDLSRAPAVVQLSAAVLRQIVYNLVQNALDASPPNGVVTVTAIAVPDALELHVSDDGPGVPPELRDRIFEAFFSTKDARMRTSGMGLGLALVRRSVDSAGGRIDIRSSTSGGALFVVTLPIVSAGART